MPGAGLVRGDVGIGDEVHVRARDARAVGGEDDRAVHLGELRQPLRRELGVEQEAARADVQDRGTVADDDERAHLRLQDAVDALPQRGTRGHEPQRGVENFRSALRQQILPVGTESEATPRRTPAAASASRRSATRRSVMPGHVGGRQRARSPSGTRGAAPRSSRRGACGHLADLAAETDLADDDRVGVDRAVVARARDRERDREIGGRLGDAHPAGDARVDVVVAERDAGALLQHRDEHREPVALERLRDPPRDRRAGGRDERLHLDAQRPRAFHDRGDDRTRSRPTRRSARNSALGSLTGEQPARGHLHEPELVGGAEPVLQRAQHAQRVVTIALERQHGVDDVLERARPGERHRPS